MTTQTHLIENKMQIMLLGKSPVHEESVAIVAASDGIVCRGKIIIPVKPVPRGLADCAVRIHSRTSLTHEGCK